jgi:HK97 family phage major capsid protein
MKLKLTPQTKRFLINHGVAMDASDDEFRNAVKERILDGSLSMKRLSSLQGVKDMSTLSGPSAAKMFSGERIKIKAGGRSYDGTKSIGVHSKLSTPILDQDGRPAQTSSELENAKAGVFLKVLAGRSGLQVSLTDHERALWQETLEQDLWCGQVGGQWQRGVDGMRVKTLLDDSTSGGSNVVPEWFDANLVSFPLLNGELFPLVDVRNIPRGSSVEGASVGNPTVTWGVAEGTSMAPFNTDSLIAGINSTIHPVTCAIEVGRDFLADSPADVGAQLTQNIAQRLLAELDRVIADGDGLVEPEGIFQHGGVSAVTLSGAAPTVADYEELLFTVGKQYRKSPRCCFVANDTAYQRARAIPVDTSNDQRRVFGMEVDRGSGASVESYSILGRPYKIENNLANTHAAFGDLARYRMYRRQGFSIEWHTQGATLAKANLALLVVRGRFGGKVVDPSAFAKWEDAEA